MNDTTPDCNSDADPSAISIEQAQERIANLLPEPISSERIDLSQAFGRILAQPIHSALDVPPFRNSAMDGYAFRHQDAHLPLQVIARSLAGHPSEDQLSQGECIRVTTGAYVANDADTVVQHEHTLLNEDGTISLIKIPALGLNVRAIGSDSLKGSTLLTKGNRLNASEIALLASHGETHVSVKRRLKIAVFSTGDELLNPGDIMRKGTIMDANRPLLLSLMNDPCFELLDLGIVADSIAATESTLLEAAQADVVISSGGVSVGEADFVRPVLERIGKLHLWKIAMKPGRPLTFGLLKAQQPYFGLPGNPVSAAITYLLFVRRSLYQMLEHKAPALPMMPATLHSALSKRPGRVEYQRGLLSCTEQGQWHVTTTGLQDSHVLSSLHKANCLIELGLHSNGAQAGETVNVIPFAHLSTPVL